MMWTEKYRPKEVGYMVGNEDVRARFYSWLKHWVPGSKPALLLGPPGTGKTTLVHAAAEELGYDVMELNASDYRTKTVLERRLRPAMGGLTVFGSKILVFLDEVDGLYGRADYGGAEYVLKLISSITVPLVMAANREDVGHMPGMERASLVMKFKRIPSRLMELYLRYILKSEGRALDREVILNIVKYASGDMRAAINGLQAIIYGGGFEGGYRDVRMTLRDAVTEAASNGLADEAYAILRTVDAQPQEKIRAVYATLTMGTQRMDPAKFARSMRLLSEADILYSRIIKTRNWKLLRYLDRILAASLAGTHAVYSEYDTPYNISSRIWNEGKVLRKTAKVMSKAFHVSRKEFMTYYFDTFVLFSAKNGGLILRLGQLTGESDKSIRKVLNEEHKRLLGGNNR